MKVRIEIPITFKVLYSDKNAAQVKDCKVIERKIQQSITIEIPDEVAGLLQNLKWSKTRGLWISIQAETNVDLDTITGKQEGSKGKGIREKLKNII
jgi:hypothetical protein